MKFEVYKPGYGTISHTDSVSCVEPEEVLNSMSAAGYKFKVNGKIVAKSNVYAAVGQATGLSESQVKHKIKEFQDARNGISHSKSSTKHSEPTTNEDTVKAEAVPNTQPASTSKRKVTRIKVVETGEVYKNMTEAGKALGIDPASISDAVKLGRPRGGYHFERVE